MCHHLLFFFNDTAPTEIYTLSLHDALPICGSRYRSSIFVSRTFVSSVTWPFVSRITWLVYRDRKSTRLNSSHSSISYAVFCLKKKKNNETNMKLILQLVTRDLAQR